MKKCFLFLLIGTCTLSVNSQKISEKGFYVKAGSSYFFQVTPVEFPEVSGYNAEESVWHLSSDLSSKVMVSSRSVTGSFGEGKRISLRPGIQDQQSHRF